MSTGPQNLRNELLIAAVVAFSAFYFLLNGVVRPVKYPHPDFQAYYSTATLLNQGRDPYLEMSKDHTLPHGRYLYSPVFATVLRPLTRLSERTAGHLWSIGILTLCYVGGLAVVHRLMGLKWLSAGSAVLVLVAGTAFPIIVEKRVGNCNSLSLLLISLSCLLSVQKKPFSSGLLLGASLLLKPSGYLLLLFQLLRGRIRFLAGAVTVLVIGFAFTVALYGPAMNISYFSSLIPSRLASGVNASLSNESFPATLVRMFQDNPATRSWCDCPLFVRAADLLLRGFIFILSVYFLILGTRRNVDERLLWGLMILTSLLLVNILWIHHLVLLILPLGAFLSGSILFDRKSRLCVFVAGWALSMLEYGVDSPWATHGLGILLSSGNLWGLILLWGLSLSAIRGSGRSLAAGGAEAKP